MFLAFFCDKLAPMSFLPRPLSVSLDKIAREAIGRDWSLYAALLDHWREIVGEDYAKNTAPVKIAFPKGKKPDEKWAGRRTGGQLVIKLPQGLAMEFAFHTESIRARINGFFGYPAIEKLCFETYYPEYRPESPLESPRIDDSDKRIVSDSVESIDNNELKDALQRIGESIMSREK